MQPKTLQSILRHSNIGVTMNIYVHCTDDRKAQEMKNIASMLKAIGKIGVEIGVNLTSEMLESL